MTTETQPPEPTLKPRQRQEIRAVIKNDFKVLREEIEYQSITLNRAAEEAVKDELSTVLDKCPDFLLETQTIVARANKELDDLKKKGAKIGVIMQSRFGSRTSEVVIAIPDHTWTPLGLQEKINDFRSTLSAEKRKADIELNRKESNILRELALEGIPEREAARFLSEVPTVEELLPMGNRFAGVIEAASH